MYNSQPTWQTFLLSHASDDLLMIERKRRLYYEGHPVELHWLDRVSLLLIRQAYVRRQSLVLCYPIPVCNLATLAAAQLLLYDFVLAHRTEAPRTQSLSVLLISSRLEARQQYLNLTVGGEPLACALPLARIRAEGQPALIPVPGKTIEQKPRLYHLSRPHLLEAPWPRDVGAIIVDHSDGSFYGEAMRIHGRAVRQGISTVIHLCADPFATFIQELEATNIPVWVWDHHGLVADFREQITTENTPAIHPFGVSTQQFKNIATGIRHHILNCRHQALETAAHGVWDELGKIQRSLGDRVGPVARRAIGAAYGAFYAMFQLLVPLPVYEEEARSMWGIRPISRRIADLKRFEELLREEMPDLAGWRLLVQLLQEMQEALMVSNPKYELVIQQVHEHLSQKKDLVIICPNQATRQMLQLCLQAREGLRLDNMKGQRNGRAVQLVTYKELDTFTSSDTLLFPGQFSYSRRHYALTAAASEIRYLAYGDEANRIEKQIAAIRGALAEMAGPEKRQRVWASLAPLSSDGRLPEVPPQSGESVIEFVRSESRLASLRTTTAAGISDLSLWTPFSAPDYDLVREHDVISDDDEEALSSSDFRMSPSNNILVSALQIEFENGFCYAEPDSRMTVFLPATGKTDHRRADGLRPGDIVVFVDGEQRRQLYEVILKRIERHPAMGATYILVRYWQQAVRAGFSRSGMTYDGFLQELRQRGSSMQTTAGVRFWVVGEVLGPDDPEDIRRTGEVFNDEVLLQKWKDIDRALRKIRGLHISLALKLNRMIVQAGLKSRHPDTSEECIDAGLNLYLDDFRDSVGLHHVTAISQDVKQVPYVSTGKFFEKEIGVNVSPKTTG